MHPSKPRLPPDKELSRQAVGIPIPHSSFLVLFVIIACINRLHSIIIPRAARQRQRTKRCGWYGMVRDGTGIWAQLKKSVVALLKETSGREAEQRCYILSTSYLPKLLPITIRKYGNTEIWK